MLTGFGVLTALVVWSPLALRKLPLSLPIVCITLGAALFSLPQVTLKPLPLIYPEISERFTEFVVIIALIGAGLRIDWVFRWRDWAVTWRLLSVTMPLGIVAIMVVTAWGMSLPWAIALLLAASLAPTDPVLAADIQVGPPKSEHALSSKSSWVSVTGTAEAVDDVAKEKELWNAGISAWFPNGLKDPEIVVVRVRADGAEYWDSPDAGIVSVLSFVKAHLTGKPYHIEDVKVEL